MIVALRKALLLALVACHAYVGAGAGERVVYFGHDHGADESCGHRHEHPHAPHALRFLPIFVPVGFEHRSDRPHDHDCGHAHLHGQEATPPATPRATPTPVAALVPTFLSGSASVVEAAPLPSPVVAARPRPPDRPPGAVVRLQL